MSEHSGVMDAEYASERQTKPHLSFRYRVRAKVAVEAFLARGARRAKDVRVLDMGCAEGATLLEIRRLLKGGGSYVGVELSDSLLASAPALPPNTQLLKGDIQALPGELEAGSFDLVVALAVLEHLPDPGAALKEAYRMLRPGGVLVASCPNPVWDDIADKLGLMKGEHHEQEMDRDTMVRFAHDAGFVKVEYRPFMFAPVGFLPYLKLKVDPDVSLKIDAALLKARPLHFTFVNQAVVAEKPSA